MKREINYILSLFLVVMPWISFAQNPQIDSLENVFKTSKEDTARINALNNLFLEYEFTDDKKATDCLNEALKLAQKINFKTGLATTYLYFGFFSEDKGNFPEALKNYQLSLKINEFIGNKKGMADCYNNMGNVYGSLGNYPEALKSFFASLRMIEQNILPGGTTNNKRGIAAAYGNIGSVYYFQENYTEALKNQLACIKIMKEIGHKQGEANSYNNIGIIYASRNMYKEALENYSAGLAIRLEIADKAGVADSYIAIGNIYSRQADDTKDPDDRKQILDEALKNHFASLKIKSEIGEKSGIALNFMNIGLVYIKLKDYSKAESYLIRSSELSKKIGQKLYLRNVYRVLENLDSIRGNFKSAYENHKLYILHRDSLDNEQTQKKTIQNQMTYDFEKKEAVAAAEHKKELENQEVLAGEKSRKQKIIILLVVVGLLLVLMFAGFIFRSLRVTRKQKDIIELQKNIVEKQKQEVEDQKARVEEHQKEIIDSITYARRIQRSLLPTEKYVEKTLNRLNKKN